jgi:ATP-binding cassette, subfamily B, multidrug efflux pump
VINRLDTLLSGLASLRRIFSALDWEEEPDNGKVAISTKTSGHIKFENVWFAYKGAEWALKDVNLDIPSGTKVGIVGSTGSGKSTLVNLLLRFYEPQKGRILLDGIDIREYPLNQLRSIIGYVQQDAWFFDGTVRENLELWSKDRSSQIEATINHSLFNALPKLDESIEDRGYNLSAGTRQLLSFARTLVGSPLIWILDEASAHLDPALDRQLNDALVTFKQDATSLVIAHRLSSVWDCDKIIVLSYGTLKEQGNHQQLLEQDGIYATLYRSQEKIISLSHNSIL